MFFIHLGQLMRFWSLISKVPYTFGSAYKVLVNQKMFFKHLDQLNRFWVTHKMFFIYFDQLIRFWSLIKCSLYIWVSV